MRLPIASKSTVRTRLAIFLTGTVWGLNSFNSCGMRSRYTRRLRLHCIKSQRWRRAAGIGIDIVGYGLDKIPAQQVAAINAASPRLAIKERLKDALELGGANDVHNLWPQPRNEAHAKDRVEDELHEAVWSARMRLANAQQRIVRDWERAVRASLR